MTRGKTLVFGMVVGALGLALYWQLRRVATEDDPEALMDRLESQLADLEKKVDAMQKSAT